MTGGVNWRLEGPLVLDWLREYLRDHPERGALTACCDAFRSHGVTPDALYNFLNRQGKLAWKAIKAGQPAPTKPETPRVPPTPSQPAASAPVQEVTKQQKENGEFEARSNGRKIKTVADLLTYIEADLTHYEVASSEATKYEGLTKDDDGNPVVTEMFRVFVRLKPKRGPSVEEKVEAILSAAFRIYVPRSVKAIPTPKGDLWQLINLFDTHFGKHAWRGSTGGPDYDLKIADRSVRVAAADLIARGNVMLPARRSIVLGGDVFHADTAAGTTTGGTHVERDGRYQKMLDVGTDAIVAVIEMSAETVPTDVYVVPGNHDVILSCALQRILRERFRLDKRVTVNAEHTSRKYLTWGKNLIGITHGDKAREKLPQLMALDCPELWGASTYREYHTGHLHYQSAKQAEHKVKHLKRIETIDGVVVRIAPSLGPADDWHAENGYIGAARGMETFFYRKTGGLAAMFVSPSPEVVAV